MGLSNQFMGLGVTMKPLLQGWRSTTKLNICFLNINNYDYVADENAFNQDKF